MFKKIYLSIIDKIKLLPCILFIIFILLAVYNIYDIACSDTHAFLFDSDTDSIASQEWTNRPVQTRSIQELDGIPIYEMSGTGSQYQSQVINPEVINGTRTYNAYNPNYVYTNEGWRTELPENSYSACLSYNDYNVINPDYRNAARIPNVSSYPAQYPIDSYPLGEIEPSRSHLKNNTVHWADQNPMNIKDSHNTSFISNFKDKVNNKLSNLDRKLEKDLKKYHESRILEQVESSNNYFIKGQGWITRKDLRDLNRKGFTVQNSKVVKLPFSQK